MPVLVSGVWLLFDAGSTGRPVTIRTPSDRHDVRDANMVHGWPPSSCATERVISLGHSMPPPRAGRQPLHPTYAQSRVPLDHRASAPALLLVLGIDSREWPKMRQYREGSIHGSGTCESTLNQS